MTIDDLIPLGQVTPELLEEVGALRVPANMFLRERCGGDRADFARGQDGMRETDGHSEPTDS